MRNPPCVFSQRPAEAQPQVKGLRPVSALAKEVRADPFPSGLNPGAGGQQAESARPGVPAVGQDLAEAEVSPLRLGQGASSQPQVQGVRMPPTQGPATTSYQPAVGEGTCSPAGSPTAELRIHGSRHRKLTPFTFIYSQRLDFTQNMKIEFSSSPIIISSVVIFIAMNKK